MSRYNIFNQIHKGLRALLYETALQLQQTDFNNSDEAESILVQLKIVTDLFDKHADTEDDMVFTAIQPYEPSVIDAFEQEHVEDKALSLRLEESQNIFSLATSPKEKLAAGEVINLAFVEFMIFNLRHMAAEEDIINKILWKFYNDHELHNITKNIVASTAPGMMALYSKWMMRGLNTVEISGWLKEVKNKAPDFIFNGLLKTAVQELHPKRWEAVQETLTEGAMIA